VRAPAWPSARRSKSASRAREAKGNRMDRMIAARWLRR
jgi:hypothetical protein